MFPLLPRNGGLHKTQVFRSVYFSCSNNFVFSLLTQGPSLKSNMLQEVNWFFWGVGEFVPSEVS